MDMWSKIAEKSWLLKATVLIFFFTIGPQNLRYFYPS